MILNIFIYWALTNPLTTTYCRNVEQHKQRPVRKGINIFVFLSFLKARAPEHPNQKKKWKKKQIKNLQNKEQKKLDDWKGKNQHQKIYRFLYIFHSLAGHIEIDVMHTQGLADSLFFILFFLLNFKPRQLWTNGIEKINTWNEKNNNERTGIYNKNSNDDATIKLKQQQPNNNATSTTLTYTGNEKNKINQTNKKSILCDWFWFFVFFLFENWFDRFFVGAFRDFMFFFSFSFPNVQRCRWYYLCLFLLRWIYFLLSIFGLKMFKFVHYAHFHWSSLVYWSNFSLFPFSVLILFYRF